MISDGAQILTAAPSVPKPETHIIDWFHIAMKIQPMQRFGPITWPDLGRMSLKRILPSPGAFAP